MTAATSHSQVPGHKISTPFTTIAAQCCAGEGEPGVVCRRRPDSNGQRSYDNDNCIAGKSDTGVITNFTYAETKYFCDSLGLELCQQSCKGQGCNYDQYAEITSPRSRLA